MCFLENSEGLNEYSVNGRWLPLTVCHRKSMGSRAAGVAGKAVTETWKEIVEIKPYATARHSRPKHDRSHFVRKPCFWIFWAASAIAGAIGCYVIVHSGQNFRYPRYIRQSQPKPEKLVHKIVNQYENQYR